VIAPVQPQVGGEQRIKWRAHPLHCEYVLAPPVKCHIRRFWGMQFTMRLKTIRLKTRRGRTPRASVENLDRQAWGDVDPKEQTREAKRQGNPSGVTPLECSCAVLLEAKK
jgi:hypothetical protein